MASEFAIRAEGLTKYYGASRGVVGLDLEVRKGEIFGFLGPNGAGKTTTIRLLMGLIGPTSGAAFVSGQQVTPQNTSLHERIGYIPGEPGLYPHLTPRKFINRFASLRRNGGAEKGTQLADRLSLPLDKKVKTFSHGMKQKLAIVLAFMSDADLLILDEPTSGLDPIAQQEFYKLVSDEHGAGKTVFLSSHILTEVERVCHRVGIIRDGKLIVVENIEDLKRKRVKHIEVKFASEVDEKSLSGRGVKSISRDGDWLKLAVDGDFQDVLRRVGAYPIDNISIHDASLEEIFLEYYADP